MESKVSFADLDLGTAKPTAVPMETIEVVINPHDLLGAYADAFIDEAWRKNPRLMERLNLEASEMIDYCAFLLAKRIECVGGACKDYRALKVAYIPAWIQYNLSMIGEVIIREKGLRMVPVIDFDVIDLSEALRISEKVGALEDDLVVLQDALPRSPKGDRDVMSTALIAGYVRAIEEVEHDAKTYVTAFLGMKIRQEAAMAVLYRTTYDDVEYIARALTAQRGWLK